MIAGLFGYYSESRPEASGIDDIARYLPEPATIRYAKFALPLAKGTANFDTFTMKSRKSDYSYRWHLISIRGASAQLIEDCSPIASDNRINAGATIAPVRVDSKGLNDLKRIDIPDYVYIYGFDAVSQKYKQIKGGEALIGGNSYLVTSRDPITCLTFRSSGEYTNKIDSAPAVKVNKGWNLVAPPASPNFKLTNDGDQYGTSVTRLSALGSTSPAYIYRDKEGFAKTFPITTTQASPECKDFSCWEVGSGAMVYSYVNNDMIFNQSSSAKYALPGTHTDSFATDKPNWQ